MTFNAADLIPKIDEATDKLVGYLTGPIDQDDRAVLFNALSAYITELACLRKWKADHAKCIEEIQADQVAIADRENVLHERKDREIARLRARDAAAQALVNDAGVSDKEGDPFYHKPGYTVLLVRSECWTDLRKVFEETQMALSLRQK